MDFAPSSKQLCYVCCNFCNIVLLVGIPCKRLVETVTVKCGHCSNLSSLSTMPQLQSQFVDCQDQLPLLSQMQVFSTDHRKGQSTQSALTFSSTPSEQLSPKAHFVVKPPEKKHRRPSAYNQFMREEIKRIKAANPRIPHREAFSSAAKNWARCVPATASAPKNNKKKEELLHISWNTSVTKESENTFSTQLTI